MNRYRNKTHSKKAQVMVEYFLLFLIITTFTLFVMGRLSPLYRDVCGLGGSTSTMRNWAVGSILIPGQMMWK